MRVTVVGDAGPAVAAGAAGLRLGAGHVFGPAAPTEASWRRRPEAACARIAARWAA